MMSARPLIEALLWFDATGAQDRAAVRDRETEDGDAGKEERCFCCANCNARITTAASLVVFNGASVHCRTNPAGQAFCFSCFSTAPGCGVSGRPTYEHTWFQNYRWQFANCRSCGVQLGWYFTGAQQVFGLIQRNLVECRN